MKYCNQNQLAAYMEQIIYNTYYDYWNLDEREHPILDHAVFVTYRLHDSDRRNEPMTAGFHRWSREMIKNLAQQHEDRFWVYGRQPVGMYAMDYQGSKYGKADEKADPHVHALMVLHPDIKLDVEHQLDIKELNHMSPKMPYSNHKFWWAYYDKVKPLRQAIKYNFKGIMHEGGFYGGREDRWSLTGPDNNKTFRHEKVVVDKWGLKAMGF